MIKSACKYIIESSKSFMMIIDNIISIKYLESISKNLKNNINLLIDCDIMKIGSNKISRTGVGNIKEIINIANSN
jgi:D-serine deaminase-like pyridoxal phosphate-dependent protein